MMRSCCEAKATGKIEEASIRKPALETGVYKKSACKKESAQNFWALSNETFLIAKNLWCSRWG
jgi:hypothetical protein